MTKRVLLAAAFLMALAAAGQTARYEKAPEFPSQNPRDWIGPPQSLRALQGKVVLLDVWTFLCVNCVNTIPWVKEMEKRYADRGLVIVGVHTPEFDEERSRANVEAAVRLRGLERHSHFLDNHMNYWRALDNGYWPAIYVVDAHGQIRNKMFGEIHIGTDRDKELSTLVEKLLTEIAAAKP